MREQAIPRMNSRSRRSDTSERYDTCFQQLLCRIAGTKHAPLSLHLL